MYNPLSATASCLWMPDRISGESAWTRHLPFAFALMEALRPATFVELGTHRGDSYCAFCQTVKRLSLPTTCYAVDTWNGDGHSGLYGPEVWEELRAYHDPLYSDFSTLLKMTFDQARRLFAEGSVDLLHIDGCHSYEAARHDFEMWLPAMSPRGIVLLHDILPRDRGFGVWQLWEELTGRFDHIALNHTHGLGVLAVGPEKPEAFSQLWQSTQESDVALQMFDALGARIDLLIDSKCTRERIEALHLELTARQAQIERLDALVKDMQGEQANREEALKAQARALVDQQALLADKEALLLAQGSQLAAFQLTQEALREQIDRLEEQYGKRRYQVVARASQWMNAVGSALAPARWKSRVAGRLANQRAINNQTTIRRPEANAGDATSRFDAPQAAISPSQSGQGVLRERKTAHDHS